MRDHLQVSIRHRRSDRLSSAIRSLQPSGASKGILCKTSQLRTCDDAVRTFPNQFANIFFQRRRDELEYRAYHQISGPTEDWHRQDRHKFCDIAHCGSRDHIASNQGRVVLCEQESHWTNRVVRLLRQLRHIGLTLIVRVYLLTSLREKPGKTINSLARCLSDENIRPWMLRMTHGIDRQHPFPVPLTRIHSRGRSRGNCL